MIIGIDFETTGLDPKTHHPSEVGIVVWDEYKNTPVITFNELIFVSEALFTPEIEKLTGISKDDTTKYGKTLESVSREVMLIESVVRANAENDTYFMAHNTPFDKAFFEHHFYTSNLPWIDSCVDIEYPEEMKTRKLGHLASDHNFLNPFSHRAIFDVLTMFKIASQYNWDTTKENAKSKTITLKAMVDYHTKDKAKENGFRYNPNDKTWIKQVKENKTWNLPFDVEIISP